VEEIPNYLVPAEQALETCRKVGDKLTPRRFIAATREHLAKRPPTANDLRRAWNEAMTTLRRLVADSEAASRPAGS
jgi:hypothetical protein